MMIALAIIGAVFAAGAIIYTIGVAADWWL